MSLAASINESIEALPAGLRDGVRLWFEEFAAGRKALQKEDIPALVKVVAISDFAARVVQREWPESGMRPDCLDEASQKAMLAVLADSIAGSGTSVADIKATLRRERNRCMLGILWRDAMDQCTVVETLAALSGLADQLLSIALDFAQQQLVERCGVIRDGNNEPVPMLLLGMGKLGGGELNFSSDVDYIPLYPGSGPGDGMSDGARSLHAQSYFDRLSRSLVDLLDDVTEDGFVFRVDTRLRPFGDSGPPVISFAALESYLLQHGRDWERYAYVKARLIGRGAALSVADELFDELITPFVYRGYLDYGVFESLRDMHGLIVSEGRKRELKDNIKLGPGGIREIEFIVQSLQLVRGSHRPELQSPSLLKVLPLLVEGRGLSESVAQELQDSYLFLRRLENFIQAMRDQQSHDLPRDERDRVRLAYAMGYAEWDSLERKIDRVRA
jgi:glutamate-ammonia-ligase adenylyltransferase